MLLVFTVTLPLFVLILAGYVSARRGLIDQAGIRGLTGFVFYFSLPLMLFHNMATAPVAESFNGSYVLAYVVAGLFIHLTGMAVAKWAFNCQLGEQAIQGIAASFGNTVFIAYPIAIALFGTDAALPMSLLIAAENGILMPFTIAVLEIKETGRGELSRALLAAARAIIRNPVVMSVLLGAAAALAGITLPNILDGLVNFVKGANVPCALFALGGTLAVMPLTERVAETSAMIFLKIAAYPVVVFCIMTYVVDVEPVWKAIAVLSAAMPMGANVYLVAAQYDTYVARASTAVLVSTVVSVVTVSGLSVLLGVET